jgi:ABC-type lipoprotein export system ATPase subunit
MTAKENILLSLAPRMKDLRSIKEEMKELTTALGIENVMRMKESKLSTDRERGLK